MAAAGRTEHASRRRILAAATDLFARDGFDGVSTRAIAAKTGLNIATVHHHVGSKRTLYLAVVERLYEEEEQLIAEIVAGIDDTVIRHPARFRKALFSLIDRLLEFARRNPARQRLYIRRWLEPADELRNREAELTLRLYRKLATILERGQQLGVVRRDLDIGYFLRSFDWLIVCYFASGAFSWTRLRSNPCGAAHLERFRKHLRDYTERMLEATS